MRLCIVCREREAVLPDRERMGAPFKRVCRECHAARLMGDIAKIRVRPCPPCGGSGSLPDMTCCPLCGGGGKVVVRAALAPSQPEGEKS